MDQGVCRFNQTGFCKFQSECQRYHENEMCRDDSCSRKECRKRNLRHCKYFWDNRTCKFGEGYSYIHKDNATKNVMDKIKEELKTLNTEIIVLTDTVKSLTNIKKDTIQTN